MKEALTSIIRPKDKKKRLRVSWEKNTKGGQLGLKRRAERQNTSRMEEKKKLDGGNEGWRRETVESGSEQQTDSGAALDSVDWSFVKPSLTRYTHTQSLSLTHRLHDLLAPARLTP